MNSSTLLLRLVLSHGLVITSWLHVHRIRKTTYFRSIATSIVNDEYHDIEHVSIIDTCFGVVVTHACGTKHWHTIEFFWAMPMGFGNYNCRFGTIKVFFVSISTNTCISPLELVGCAVGKTLRGSRRVWLIKHRNNWLAGGTDLFHPNQNHLIESMHLKVMALRGLGEST